jgi:hypothetical protein
MEMKPVLFGNNPVRDKMEGQSCLENEVAWSQTTRHLRIPRGEGRPACWFEMLKKQSHLRAEGDDLCGSRGCEFVHSHRGTTVGLLADVVGFATSSIIRSVLHSLASS